MAKNNWVDFKEIKTTVSIERVLERYGLLNRLKRKGDNLVGPCPIHQGTNPTQFHVSLKKNNFNCFGDCHKGGNVLDFVAKMEKKDIREAALIIQNWFGIESKRPEKEQAGMVKEELIKEELANEELSKEKEDRNNPPLKFALKHLDQNHPYLSGRGLQKETIEYFGLGYCQKGLMAGRIAIPIHNAKGELLGYVGRWPGDPPEEEPKYKLPPGFKKSLVVFNLHRTKTLAKEKGLIMVEGFFDCFRVFEAGFKNVVALMGSSLSDEQEKLILETVGPQGEISLMFDEDGAGSKCREEALERLVSQAYVKVIRLGEEGAQPDNLCQDKIRELLR